MNGIHDMGGMHGMGPIVYEPNEPVFHEPWEGRAWALSLLSPFHTGRRRNFRYEHEILPPADYLRFSYYERFFVVLVNQLLWARVATAAEIDSGQPAPGSARSTPRITPAMVAALARPGPAVQRTGAPARFRVGQQVRALNINPAGHTRLPRYTRGRRGRIVRDEGVFDFPDTDADGYQAVDKPQHVYTVQFAARELWGEQASPRDTVHVSLWEDYIARA
jgi:nitrile hydratase beta subunit